MTPPDISEAEWRQVLALTQAARDIRDLNGSVADPLLHREFVREFSVLRAETINPLVRSVFLPLIGAISAGPVTVAQLGQSLDGRIATASGHSHHLNGPQSLDHLHRLRAIVDAVVVGAGTVAADNPQLTTRRVVGPNPVRVVIDPSRRLPRDRRVFDGAAPTVVICAKAEPHNEATHMLPLSTVDGIIPPAAIVDALAARGLRTLLVEGGSHTVSAFISAQRVDRLHLMMAPLLLGSGRVSLSLPEVARIDQGLRPHVTIHPLGMDVLFDCRLR